MIPIAHHAGEHLILTAALGTGLTGRLAAVRPRRDGSACAPASVETPLRAASQASSRAETEEALLDAAERLLVDVGYAGITTRRLAEEAGVNHGLVHYYFGSNESLLMRALERFTERLVARQRELYAADAPFVEKWRTAMRFLLSEDVAYEKVWLEPRRSPGTTRTFRPPRAA